jgi:hypothetical protein
LLTAEELLGTLLQGLLCLGAAEVDGTLAAVTTPAPKSNTAAPIATHNLVFSHEGEIPPPVV